MSSSESSGAIVETSFREALEDRYFVYALETITDRALPDVRDGLKPVHRRLLHAMRLLRLEPPARFKKSARIVGDVIGKYHPHGDAAAYDALTRMAQTFAARYPLAEGWGNFGNLDGDSPAAMRYTEARLSSAASAMLEGLDEDATDLRATYDGENDEPSVMPGGLPNLLANGASGIAVGVACSVPPHNMEELCRAALRLLDRGRESDSAMDAALAEIVRGPDFPTGGVLAESAESMASSYATGRGSFRLRAAWREESAPRGGRRVVVYEMPWLIPKGRLVERLDEAMQAKRLPLLDDFRDESAEDVRLILIPRSRAVSSEAFMEEMFRLTDLEIRVPLNMNVLCDETIPRRLSLREALSLWLNHRREVTVRRAAWREGKIAERLELVEGFLLVHDGLDRAIAIIRESDDPSAELQSEFALSERQAEAILNMRLRALRRIEADKLREERDRLRAEGETLRGLIASPKRQKTALKKQIEGVIAAFGEDTELGRRRTLISAPPSSSAADRAALVETLKEDLTIALSRHGWIRAFKGHLDSEREASFKEGDSERLRLYADSSRRVLAFSTFGRAFTLSADRLPGGRGTGEPLRMLLDMDDDEEILTLRLAPSEGESERVLASSSTGRGFAASLAEAASATRKGRRILALRDDERAVGFEAIPDDADSVACLAGDGKLLIFPLDELPSLSRGRGVLMQRTSTKGLSSAIAFCASRGVALLDGAGRRRALESLEPWSGRRGRVGRMLPKGFPRSGRLVAL